MKDPISATIFLPDDRTFPAHLEKTPCSSCSPWFTRHSYLISNAKLPFSNRRGALRSYFYLFLLYINLNRIRRDPVHIDRNWDFPAAIKAARQAKVHLIYTSIKSLISGV